MGLCKVIGYLVVVVAVLVGLLLSGTLARWGAIRKLDEVMLANGKPDLVGMTPSSYAGIELPFKHADAPDQTGKVALVTGGNIGLGYYTALNLARKGADVTIVCRSKAKCDKAAKEMNAELDKPLVHTLIADNGDLTSVAAMADEFAKTHDVLDIFVQNAGVSGTNDFVATSSGVEQTFQVNHLAHFLMTEKLMPLINKSKLARIAVVSSFLHYEWKDPEYLRNAEVLNSAKHYKPAMEVLALTKLANVLFARELHDRTGDNVIVTSLHPGIVDTNFMAKVREELKEKLPALVFERVVEPLIAAFMKNAAWTSEDGALTQVYCATKATKAEGGKYFHPVAQVVPPSPLAEDAQLRKDLWAMSEQLLKAAALL